MHSYQEMSGNSAFLIQLIVRICIWGLITCMKFPHSSFQRLSVITGEHCQVLESHWQSGKLVGSISIRSRHWLWICMAEEGGRNYINLIWPPASSIKYYLSTHDLKEYGLCCTLLLLAFWCVLSNCTIYLSVHTSGSLYFLLGLGWGRVSCIPAWPLFRYVAKDNLEFLILMHHFLSTQIASIYHYT